MKSRKRTLVRIVLAAAAMLILMAATIPLWYPWAVRPILRKLGVVYAKHQRLSGRLVLHNVVWNEKHFSVHAGSVTTDSPWDFLRARGKEGTTNAQVIVSDWKLIIAPEKRSANKTGRSDPTDLPEIKIKTDEILPQLTDWFHKILLTNGVIQVAGEHFEVPWARWEGRSLRGRLHSPNHKQNLALGLDWPAQGDPRLSFEITPWNIRSEIFLNSSNLLSGTAFWRNTDIDLSAQFPTEGWIPEAAKVRAPNINIPADAIPWPGLGAVNGFFRAEWKEGTYKLNTRFESTENPEQFMVRVRADGNFEMGRIEQLQAKIPGFTASLRKPVAVRYPYQLDQPAELAVSGRLESLPKSKVSGSVQGDLTAVPQKDNSIPLIQFSLTGTNLAGFGFSVARWSGNGGLDWPRLNIAQAQLTFAEGLQLAGKGGLDLKTRTFFDWEWNGQGDLAIQKRDVQISVQDLKASLFVSGPLTNLVTKGSVETAEWTWGHLSPGRSRLAWAGQAALEEKEGKTQLRSVKLEHLSSDWQKGQASASAKASAEFDGAWKIALQSFNFQPGGAEPVTLMAPAYILVDPKADWVVIKNFRVQQGSEAEIRLEGQSDFPDHGDLRFAIHNVRSDWATNFITDLPFQAKIDLLEGSAQWSNSPVFLDFASRGNFLGTNLMPIRWQLRVKTDAQSAAIDDLEVTVAEKPLAKGSATLPVVLRAGTPWKSWFQTNGPLSLQLDSVLDPSLAKAFLQRWEVQAKPVSARFSLGGQWPTPEGQLQIEAPLISWRPQQTNRILTLENLAASIRLNRETVEIDSLNWMMEKRPVQVTGSLPLGSDSSMNWKKFFDWRKGNFELSLDKFPMAAFASWEPDLIAPQGDVTLRLATRPGGKFDGVLELHDAATRPLAPWGPIQDIAARIRLKDREILFDDVRGSIGGEPIKMAGRVNLNQKLPSGMPALDLHLTGTNVPLVRQPELILRSSLDLRISNLTNDPPLISGHLNLSEGYFLSSLKTLVPGNVARPERRPPYFSITRPPFSAWRLDVRASGQRFLSVRNPLFRGELSMNVRTLGTLAEPLASGEVRVDSGLIQFPFSNLEVKQGLVSLTSENPYHPKLFVRAGARTYGYDVQLEVTGTADEPILEFSSTPPLSSEQIVLMLTAGELPRSDVGFSNRQKAAKVGMFLGKSLLSKFGVNNPGGERLIVRSGEHLTETGKATYSIEYKMTDKWSLIGEYDRFNEFNAGVKWRILSR